MKCHFKNEIWKDIPNYEGYYQISNCGNIRSVDKYIVTGKNKNGKRLIKGKILKQQDRNGYKIIGLKKDTIRKSYDIHRLVAITFFEKFDKNLVVNHKDRNKSNNNLNNLELCTQKENVYYSIEFMKKPHNCKLPKLTNEKYIRKRRNKYELTINKKYIGTYSTLNEAIKKRNNLLNKGDD